MEQGMQGVALAVAPILAPLNFACSVSKVCLECTAGKNTIYHERSQYGGRHRIIKWVGHRG
jgi:hypothetical protein